MYKSVILTILFAAVLADTKSKRGALTAAPTVVLVPEAAPAGVTGHSAQVVVQNHNVPALPVVAKTSRIVSATYHLPPLISQHTSAVPSPPLVKSSPIIAARILAKPGKVVATRVIASSAPVAARSIPIIATKAAPIVAAPALTNLPLVAAPLVVKSKPAVLSQDAPKAALLAGPRVASTYNSVISRYVLPPYVSSSYISAANYI